MVDAHGQRSEVARLLADIREEYEAAQLGFLAWLPGQANTRLLAQKWRT